MRSRGYPPRQGGSWRRSQRGTSCTRRGRGGRRWRSRWASCPTPSPSTRRRRPAPGKRERTPTVRSIARLRKSIQLKRWAGLGLLYTLQQAARPCARTSVMTAPSAIRAREAKAELSARDCSSRLQASGVVQNPPGPGADSLRKKYTVHTFFLKYFQAQFDLYWSDRIGPGLIN